MNRKLAAHAATAGGNVRNLPHRDRRLGQVIVSALGIGALAACGGQVSEPERSSQRDQSLELDPNFAPDDPLAHAYTLFEADPVRPIAVLPSTGLVAVANTPDDYLDLARPQGGGVEACGAIKVGMRPVAVAVVRESRTEAELWVVNHLSGSIS